MMEILDRATRLGFVLTAKSQAFCLYTKDDTFTVYPKYSVEVENLLWLLERAVQFKENKRFQAEAKHAARVAALAKLSEEEKELLGL